MNSRFTAQDQRPTELIDVDLNCLTPFYRTLLVNDGTVTPFIEAYLHMPVEVKVVLQKQQQLEQDHTWLAAAVGTPVLHRQVILKSTPADQTEPLIHAYATSCLIKNRLPDPLLNALQGTDLGLGYLLHENALETRRQLLWYGMEYAPELSAKIGLPSTAFLSRSYLIIRGGLPMMMINEKFPCVET